MRKPRVYETYWLHSPEHTDPTKQGYVGVSSIVTNRIKVFRKRKPRTKFLVTILHRGTRTECLAYERELRPDPRIGWNTNTGGGASPLPSKRTRRKMSRSAKARARTPAGRERLREAGLTLAGEAWLGRKHKNSTKQIISRKAKARARTPKGRKLLRQAGLSAGSGEEHPNYGLVRSAETRAKISSAKKGCKPKLTKAVRQSKAEKMRLHWQDPIYLAKMAARSAKMRGDGNPNYDNQAPGRPQRGDDGKYVTT